LKKRRERIWERVIERYLLDWFLASAIRHGLLGVIYLRERKNQGNIAIQAKIPQVMKMDGRIDFRYRHYVLMFTLFNRFHTE
jgi:hypothetical protein